MIASLATLVSSVDGSTGTAMGIKEQIKSGSTNLAPRPLFLGNNLGMIVTRFLPVRVRTVPLVACETWGRTPSVFRTSSLEPDVCNNILQVVLTSGPLKISNISELL